MGIDIYISSVLWYNIYMTEKNSQTEYDKLLLSLIPRLGEISFLHGGEGQVYFVDDNFVVKRYYKFSAYNHKNFENTLRERKLYYKMGLSVNEVYSGCISDDRCYMLAKREKGKTIFQNKELHKIYELCKSFCTEEEFEEALHRQEGELFTEIAVTLANEFLECNSNLSNLPESVVENFISTDKYIKQNGKNTYSDIRPQNIILDDNKMTIIDLSYIAPDRNDNELNDNMKFKILSEIMELFYYNRYFVESQDREFRKIKGCTKLSKIVHESQHMNAVALEKWMRMLKELVAPQITEPLQSMHLVNMINSTLLPDDAQDVLSKFQRDFEKF